eukprot:m.32341 g.32341  ORF g.32341 m.32341 type:complete len:746 (+) comp10011_c0_seq2:184-2421(+)
MAEQGDHSDVAPMETDSGAATADTDVPMSEESVGSVLKPKKTQEQLGELVKQYFFQLTTGCGKEGCDNAQCASNPATTPMAPNHAAAQALKLAGHDGVYTCLPTSVLTAESLRQLTERAKAGEIEPLKSTLYKTFSAPELLNACFLDRTRPGDPQLLGLDCDQCTEAAQLLGDLAAAGTVSNTMFHAVAQLSDQLRSVSTPSEARHIALLFELPIMLESDAYDNILPRLCRCTAGLPRDVQQALVQWWGSRSAERLQWILRMFHQFVTIRILMQSGDEDYSFNFDTNVIAATKVLELLHRANAKLATPLAASEFHNDAINENMNRIDDFTIWKGLNGPSEEPSISFCNYAFVLNVATKASIMNLENRWLQNQERRHAMLEALFQGRVNMYLKLSVHRDSVVRDAIDQLSMILLSSPRSLKKPLKVQFVGEEGVDEGGVQKEFFQIVLRDLFDPNYGMFSYDQEQRLFWFNPGSLETPAEFRLLGLVLGLALYNNVILDLHFPKLVYKKLLGVPVGLSDLEELNPMLFKSFNELLAYDKEDIQDVFPYHFVVEYEGLFGEKQQVELCEGGSSVPLTLENRRDFVDQYVRWLLHTAVESQFGAFKEGFFSVCAGAEALQLFDVDEIRLLLCGTEDLDFEALEKVTIYDGGYEPETPVIQWFWELVKNEFSEEDKKQLLFFSTGSDRVPVGGLSKLKFVIGKQGPDSDRLPSAHTCFNVLLLPEYSAKDKLDRLLRNAIRHAEGFGML